MKFSVAIPCHDRLDLLKEAVYTVLQQDWMDWELVIFDNGSKVPLAEYLKDLSDPRIRCNRSDEFLPVTDSWNRAIDMATGDYVLMLGDDDGLTPNYFSRMARVIEEFGNPEVLYTAFYQFMYPGVAPWAPLGYVAEIKNAFFFVGQKDPFLLSSKQAHKAVEGSLHLKRNFTFNIQAFVFSREFLLQLKQNGPVFNSPFPDYYLANVTLAKAKSVVVVPDPMIIAATSKVSFGYALFNEQEERVVEILNCKLSADPLFKEVEQLLLPGPFYNSGYVLTMEYVSRYCQASIPCRVDFRRYRQIQIFDQLVRNKDKKLSDFLYMDRLSNKERTWAKRVFLLLKLVKSNKICLKVILACLKRTIRMHAFKAQTRDCNKSDYKCLVDVYDALHKGVLR